MPSPLASIYSTADSFKRSLLDMLSNPVEAAQQIVGNANDRAGILNKLTAEAAQEGRNGGPLFGPKSQQLAGTLADAYNPAGMIGANIAAKVMPKTKILDEAGMPRLVYRGSRMEKSDPLAWNEARQSQSGKGQNTGQWFAGDPSIASSYAGSRRQQGYTAPAYLDVKNPLIVDAGGSFWGHIPKEALGELGKRIPKDTLTTDEIARIAKAQGYDGVHFKNVMDRGPDGAWVSDMSALEKPTDVFVTFNPEAARSALSDEQMKGLIGNL